jgi:type VI secretion system protein ImpG
MFNKYFQDELVYLRELGREFAQAYPTLAPLLADRGVDPDVERLLEGVAFLTGRIRQKLDDELPEFMQSLGLLLFPHLMRPLPSASILEITPVANALREAHVVKAGTEFASVPVDGVSCTFQSTTDCTLAPISIEDVRLEALPGGRQQLAITLRSLTGAPLANALPASLRLHFTGEPHVAFALLFAVNRQLADVTLSPVQGRGAARELSLGTKVLRWVGFEEDEGLLPLGRHVFPGFRLLEEYYVMPSKFAFVDIGDVRRMAELDKEATRVTLGLRFERGLPPTTRVTTQNVKLHCVPIVNAFETTAEPIRLVASRERFVVRPAGLPPSHGEVYAIQKVQAILRGSTNRVTIPGFYEFSHTSSGEHGFYTTHVSPSVTGDGADVLISFGSPEGAGNRMVDAETISLDLLATNRSVPTSLRPGDVNVHTASSPAFVTFSNILAMTPHVSTPLGRDLQWRAVAHAAIGLRALTEPEVLRAVIDVYNLHAIVDRQAARANELRVAAIKDVRVRPEERLHRGAAVRGVAIDVDLDEDGFAGDGDLFLFSAVLDRMLGEHVSINSFAHTTFRTLRSKLELRWPPRSGNTMLL